MINKNNNHSYDSMDLVQFIYKRWKIFLIVVIIAGIVSSIVSMLITPKFESSVILFPASSSSVSKSLLSSNVSNKSDVLQFGEDEEAERLFQVLNSNRLMNKINTRFDLIKHYKIDTTKVKFPKTAFSKIYDDNFTFKRTKYMAIAINVLDENPSMAAKMANYAAEALDSIMNKMHQSRATKAYNIVKNEYLSLQRDIREMEDTLDKIRKHGVYDYEKQAEVYSAAYAEAIANGKKNAVKNLEKKLDKLGKYGGDYFAISEFIEFEKEKLSDLKARYKEVKVEANRYIPYVFIVDQAYEAEQKSYPIRWLIVVVTVVSSVIGALVIMLIVSQIKQSGLRSKNY